MMRPLRCGAAYTQCCFGEQQGFIHGKRPDRRARVSRVRCSVHARFAAGRSAIGRCIQVDAGPLQFENIAGYSIDLGHLSSSAGFPVDVLIGAPAFKYGSVKVDYPGRKLTFGRSGQASNCEATIPLEIAHDVSSFVRLRRIERPLSGAPHRRYFTANGRINLGFQKRLFQRKSISERIVSDKDGFDRCF